MLFYLSHLLFINLILQMGPARKTIPIYTIAKP